MTPVRWYLLKKLAKALARLLTSRKGARSREQGAGAMLTPAPQGPAVLLFRGYGLLSWCIRWQTRGVYSHAALLMPDGRIVESWPGVGVRVRFLTDWSDVDVFDVVGLDENGWNRAIAYALAQQGAGYDWLGVLRFVSRRQLDLPETTRWFCSELDMESIHEGGVNLLERVRADEVSPQMMSLSPLLVLRERSVEGRGSRAE